MFYFIVRILLFSNLNTGVINVLDDEEEAERAIRREQEAADHELALRLDWEEYNRHHEALDRNDPHPEFRGRGRLRLDYYGRQRLDAMYDEMGITGDRDYGNFYPAADENMRMAQAINDSIEEDWGSSSGIVSLNYPDV